jgi:hypothetical protein
MKTDELINMLGTNLEAVKGGELRNALMVALAVGAAAASCLMLAIFGLPAGALGGDYSGPKILALAFTLGLVFAGAGFLIGSARPGEPGRKPLILRSVLFFALISAGGVALVLAHPAAHDLWTAMGGLRDLHSIVRRGAVRVAHLDVAQGSADQPDADRRESRDWSPAHWARPSSRSTIPAAPSRLSCCGMADRSCSAPSSGRYSDPGYCDGDRATHGPRARTPWYPD